MEKWAHAMFSPILVCSSSDINCVHNKKKHKLGDMQNILTEKWCADL